jgi:hypothetical protein
MNNRLSRVSQIKNPVITKWQTKKASFLQIEISPSHILRIKIDKGMLKQGGDV